MSLTSRATLTAGSQALLTGSGLLAAFVTTPLVVAALGEKNYGVWCMLLQGVSYASLFDIGNSSVMKVRLASIAATGRVDELREEAGAAAAALMLTFPIFVIGMLLLWRYVAREMPLIRDMPIVVLGLLVSIILQRLTVFYSHILFGANLEYRGTLARSLIAGGTSLIDVLVILVGLGMAGMTVNRVAGSLLLLILTASVTYRHVPWFGIRRPQFDRLLRSVRENAVYVGSHWGSVLTESVEVVMAGFVGGPAVAAAYVLTTAPARLALHTFGRLTTSGNAGIGHLLGKGDYEKVRRVRAVSHVAAIALCAVVGTTAVLFNGSLLALWIGSAVNLGPATLVSFLLFTALLLMTRINQGVWMAALHVCAASCNNLVSGVAGVAVGALLGRMYGIPGLLIGLAFGRVISLVHSELHLRRILGATACGAASMVRVSLTALLLVAAATCFSGIAISNWLALGAAAALVSAGSAVIVWSVGLTADVRTDLRARARHLTLSLRAAIQARRALASTTVAG